MTIPRRIRVDLLTPEERACHEAIVAIEKMPHAHPLLTEAQALIAKAQARLADWVDRNDPTQAQFVGFPKEVPDPTAEAERAVGRAIYARVAEIMNAKPRTPEFRELDLLAGIVSRVEDPRPADASATEREGA